LQWETFSFLAFPPIKHFNVIDNMIGNHALATVSVQGHSQ